MSWREDIARWTASGSLVAYIDDLAQEVVAQEEALGAAEMQRDDAAHSAEHWRESHDIERTRADAAEAEVARLRTIVEGRSAPSDAEMREHMDAGGVWLVTEPAVRGLRPTPVTHYVESYARATVLWWTEGARWVAVRDGRPCAWPSPRSEGP